MNDYATRPNVGYATFSLAHYNVLVFILCSILHILYHLRNTRYIKFVRSYMNRSNHFLL